MPCKRKGPVVRVSGLPQPDDNTTNFKIISHLKRALQEDVLDTHTTGPDVFEQLTIELVPSCTDESEQVALIEFHDGLPGYLRGLVGTRRITTTEMVIELDTNFHGFTQLYTPIAGKPTTIEYVSDILSVEVCLANLPVAVSSLSLAWTAMRMAHGEARTKEQCGCAIFWAGVCRIAAP